MVSSVSTSTETFNESNIINNNNNKISNIIEDEFSQIADFYNGKSILVTGGTGFLGKVLLEKLLRSCPGVNHIYVLMRSKKGKDPYYRLQELLSEKVYDRVRQEQPTGVKKVSPVCGDIYASGLGLSQSDKELLINNVSVVFHSAATVKFNEPLKEAVNVNLLGTRRVIEFCHKLPKLVALIHVSTAYTNCEHERINETVYPSAISYDKVISMTESLDEDLIDMITPKLLGKKPNTYTFSKALAENLLEEECGSLPVAIIRPSIVTAAWKEPYPGWVDSLNGATGLITAAAKGVMRTFICHGEKASDIIPVDVVVNFMLTIAWYTAMFRPNGVLVYHCTSGSINRITWSELFSSAKKSVFRYPSAQLFRYPQAGFKRNASLNSLCVLLDHYIPALIVDFITILFRKKPRMFRLYWKMQQQLDHLRFFCTHQWDFMDENMRMLSNQLTGKDKETFAFDISRLNWFYYWENHVIGIRKFLLKEDPSTVPLARKRLKLYLAFRVFYQVILFLLWNFVVSQFFESYELQIFITLAIVWFQHILFYGCYF